MQGKHPNRVRELRLAAGMKQRQLAERVGVSVQELSKLERGERRLTFAWMERLGSALGVTPAAVADARFEQAPQAHALAQFVDDIDELAWLDLWRRMDDERRMAVLTLLRGAGLGLPRN